MKNIIIADDSVTARMIIKQCMNIVGFGGDNFLEAENGYDVLDLLDKHEVDLVVTDLNMPEMDGEELLDQLINDSDYDCPIVFITSAGNEAKELELLERGVYAVIKKPISPNILAHKLKNLIPNNSH